MQTAGKEPIKILIIDDQCIMSSCLRLLLESKPWLKVVGEAPRSLNAFITACDEHPDIILLDIDVGDTNGLNLLPGLLNVAPQARIIILTAIHDPEMHRRAVCLGSMGIVTKNEPPDVLLQAIAKVHAGEVWLERTLMASVLCEITGSGRAKRIDPETRKIATLTAREREVITLVGQGYKNRQVADRLFIAEATVRHHLTSIFAKLGVTDRLELVIYAYRHGLARLALEIYNCN